MRTGRALYFSLQGKKPAYNVSSEYHELGRNERSPEEWNGRGVLTQSGVTVRCEPAASRSAHPGRQTLS